MDISAVIGENLKRIRLERNLSLGQLSAMCGVSKMMLSQIEKNTSNPSVNTVWKIADALELPYTSLLDYNVEGGTIISSDSIPMQPLDGCRGGLRCYYHHTQDRRFELFQMEIFPGETYISQGHGERTDEYSLVISGTLKITLDDGDHNLHAGDSISFHSDKMHSYCSIGPDVLHLIILNYYR